MSDVVDPVQDEKLGRLYPFPKPPGGGELVEAGDSTAELATPATPAEASGPVLDGEIVDEDEFRRTHTRRLVRTVANVRQHKGTRIAGHIVRPIVRHGFVISYGHVLWVRRAWSAASHGAIREQKRNAHAADDAVALAEWDDRLKAAKRERRTSMKELPETVKGPLLVALGAVALLLGILVAVGVVVELTPGGLDWVSWWTLLADIWGVGAAVLTFLIHVALYAVVPAWLWAAWKEGRGRAVPPRWLLAEVPEPTGRDMVPDESAIVRALGNLNLPAFDRRIKQGWTPRWMMIPSHDGKGWRAQLLLPEGVTVEMIVERKDVLAHNLLRLPVEVWPTQPRDKPGVMDLYVLDQGSMTKPVPAWPLLAGGTADYFKGVPVGINPQGKLVLGRLFETNWGVAGMMGSGKSTLIITTLLGAMLDPLVDIDVYCMAFNADYDPLKPRLRTLFKSDEPEQIPVVLDALRQLMGELSERGRILSDVGEPKLTRKLAASDPRMRPRVVVIDECQELFVSDVGEEAAELVEKIVAKARKYGVTLLFATPVPSADSLPRKVAKVLSNRACFAIGDHQGNDAILGTGKHKGGITATMLRPKTEDSDGTVDLGDLGTAMTVGFSSADGLMRCFYVPRGNGVDEVTPVVRRALELREKAGIDTVHRAVTPPAVRDLLEDLAAVLDTEPVNAADCPALLSREFPAWGAYRKLTGKELVAQLAELGVKVPTTGNRPKVYPDRVREALARRATADLDDE